jgi:GT2 family glycosyltransferase
VPVTRFVPTFSVILPAHNAEATVASAVASVLTQTRADLEVIVVDDGSKDGTATVVERLTDPRIRLVSQANKGLPVARNAGIALARGKYVVFLDSDDLLLPRYLELAEQALQETVRPGFAYTDAYAFDPGSGKVGRRGLDGKRPPVPPPTEDEAFLLELLERNFIYVSTTVPRGVLDDVGGFDESAPAAEDYGLWLRILVEGFRAAWIPGKQALYRIHEGQMSRDRRKLRQGESRALASVRIDDMPTPRHREMLARRRRDVELELRRLEGGAPVAEAMGRLRRGVGRLRTAAGFGAACRDNPPTEVAAAFPDLTAV